MTMTRRTLFVLGNEDIPVQKIVTKFAMGIELSAELYELWDIFINCF